MTTQLYIWLGIFIVLCCATKIVSCTSISVPASRSSTSLDSTVRKNLSIAQERLSALPKRHGPQKSTNLDVINRGGGDDGGNNAIWEGLKNGLASALAAATSKTLLAPFDTIKTMQQQSKEPLRVFEAARMICSRPQGFLELYAGLGVAVIGAMPSVALYFGVYSYSKRVLGNYMVRQYGSEEEVEKLKNYKLIRSLHIMTSAAIGNTVASFSRVPFEVMKQKLQTGEFTSTFDAISKMVGNGGLRAFFPTGGVSIQMIRDIPYAMFTLLSYEYLRDNWVNQGEPEIWKDMVAGAIAGGIGSYLTNPMDVVKTRLQIYPEVYNGNVWACAVSTFEEGGAMAFLRGSIPRLLHKVPANGCFFVFYEFFRRCLHAQPKVVPPETKQQLASTMSKKKTQ